VLLHIAGHWEREETAGGDEQAVAKLEKKKTNYYSRGFVVAVKRPG